MKRHYSYLPLLLAFACCTSDTITKAKSKQVARITFKNCVGEICFQTNVPKIDSIEEEWHGYIIEDTLAYGHLLRVYDIAKEDTSVLANECRNKGFHSLPITGPDSFPILEDKHLKPLDKGYYKIDHHNSNSYIRIEIVNLSQKKFVVFVING